MDTSTRQSLRSTGDEAPGRRRHPPPKRRSARKTRAVAYLRVSTIQQQRDGKNLDGQLEEVRAYCQRNGYDLDETRDIYRDIVSGARTDRVGYYQLLARLEKEDAEVIVAWNVSRLGRNSIDGAWLMAKAKEHGHRIETAQEGLDFTMDPGSEFMFDVLTAVAKLQRNTIIQDMMRGKKTGHKNGHWVTALPPVGYEARGPRGGRVLYPTDRAALVREVFERYASGETALAISNHLRARGEPPAQSNRDGTPWAPNVIGRMLDNPVYAGFLVFRGEIAKGAHEPIIQPEVWEKVRAIRASQRARYHGRPRSRE